jgi:hypothetical protein
MSSRQVKVADLAPYVGRHASAKFNAGWGDYYYISGVLMDIEPSDGSFYLDFCEYPDDCEDCEPGNHGAYRFGADEIVHVNVGGRR